MECRSCFSTTIELICKDHRSITLLGNYTENTTKQRTDLISDVDDKKQQAASNK